MIPAETRCRLLIAGACAWVAFAPAAAQVPQQRPQFRAGVDLVEVEVSVLDRERQTVHGLTAADFAVFENGKPQPIVAFRVK